jgi:hypothetical protein
VAGAAILVFRSHMLRQGDFGTFDILIGSFLLCSGIYNTVMAVLEYRDRYPRVRTRRTGRRKRW